MRLEKSLFNKFMEYAIGSGLSLIIGLITSPIITRLISPEEYGKSSMFGVVVSVSTIILALGLDQSFVRFYYEEKEEARNKLLMKALMISLITSFLFSLILLEFKEKITIYLFNEYDINIIILIIINIVISIVNRYAFLVIRLHQNGKFYSYLQVVQKILTIILVLIFFLKLGDDYKVIIISGTFANIIISLIAIKKYNKFWFKKINKKVKLKNSTKDMLLYGIPLMCTGVISWAFQSIDKVFIKNMCDYREVGLYTSAFTIIALLNQIQTTFLNFWVPVAYEHYEKDKEDKEFFINVFNILSMVMLFISMLIIIFKNLIIMFLGSQYREASYIVPFLIFMPLMNTVSEVTVMGIGFKKKANYHIYITTICCIFNIITNYLIIPLLGAKGAAITTGITYIIYFVLRTNIGAKFFAVNYDLKRFYKCIFLLTINIIYVTFKKIDIISIFMGVSMILLLIKYYKKEIKFIINKVIFMKNKS